MDDIRAKLGAGLAALAVAAAVALVALHDKELATTALGLAGTLAAYVLGLNSDPHMASADPVPASETNPPTGADTPAA